MSLSITGMLLPLPTTFKADGELDEPALAGMASFYRDAGVDALFLLGSFGQGPAMTPEQRKRAVSVVAREVGTDLPFVVHVGAVDPYTSVDLAVHARDAGAAGIGMVGPYYYTDRSEEDLRLHFDLVDRATRLPFLFYNNPAYQGYKVSPETIRRLTDVVEDPFGVKIAKGTYDQVERYHAVLGDRMKIFAPAENLQRGLTNGTLDGTISPPLALAPEIGVAIFKAARAGDERALPGLQGAVNDLLEVLTALGPFGRAAYGAGLRHLGFSTRYPRWPTVPVPQDQIEVLGAAIDRARQAASSYGTLSV